MHRSEKIKGADTMRNGLHFLKKLSRELAAVLFLGTCTQELKAGTESHPVHQR